MKRRLAAVWRSYVTRPWTVAGGLLYIFITLIALIAAITSSGPERLHSIFDNRIDRIATLNAPSELVAWASDPTKIKSYKGISIGRRVPQNHFRTNATTTGQMRADLSHEIFQEMDAKCIDCLQRLHSLQLLELNAIQPTPALWQAIGQLKELRYLRLKTRENVEIKALPVLPKLALLSLGSVDPNELALLRNQPSLRSIELADSDFSDVIENSDQIVKLATLHEVIQLRELVINPQMQDSGDVEENDERTAKPKALKPLPVSASMCNEIRQLPNLRLVSVGERGAKMLTPFRDTGLSQAAADCATSVVVNGRSTDPVFWFMFYNWFLTVLLFAIIGAQLQYHLSTSASLLLPKFVGPHLLFPVLLIVGHMGTMTLINTQVNGSHLLPAIAESFLSATFFCMFASVSMARFLGFVLMVSQIFLIQYLPAFIESSFYRFFLIDEYPVLAIAVLTVELIVIALVLTKLARNPKFSALQNRLDESMGISLDSRYGSVDATFKPTRNSVLQRLLASRPRRFKNAYIRLWNAGFEHRGVRKFDWLWFVPTPIFIAFAGSDGFRSLSLVYRLAEFLPVGMMVLGIYILTLKTFVYMSGMSTRESHFELETLLPITKSGMRWIRLCGLWVDVWPWLIISLGSAIAGTILKSIAPQWIQMPIGLVWLIQLHSVSSAIGVWGLGMLLMTIRDAGDKRWIAYPLVIVWVFATIFVFIDRSWQQFHQIDSLDLFTALCPGVIGLFLVSIAWFRDPDMEWGNQQT